MSVPDFAAIDFETADHCRDSACAVGLVRVRGGRIAEREYRLIRPPRRAFRFTYLHGIAWEDVCDEPDFGGVWPELAPFLEGSGFLAAHNAPFDRSVLRTCCEAHGLRLPEQSFTCTVQLARRTWGLPRNGLAVVCDHLGIALEHHEALSDAEACARIVLAAAHEGAFAPASSSRSCPRRRK